MSKETEATENFKKVISDYLSEMASKDEAFAKHYANPKKDIDSCIAHIFESVRETKRIGFADEEIYSMAVHYYVEADIKNKSLTPEMVISNNSVQLSEQEIADAKKEAVDKLIQTEMSRMQSKSKPKPSAAPKSEQVTLELF